MSERDGVNRRQLLLGASATMLCACASMPRGPRQAEGGEPMVARDDDRACDHEGCRYFVREKTSGAGRCGLGLPEAFR